MKIQIKEIVEDGSELLVYVLDDNKRPMIANIIPLSEREIEINRIIQEFNITQLVEMIRYNEYINNK